MTPEEFAGEFAADLALYDLTRPRTKQTKSGLLGYSDVGFCREQARRVIVGANATDSPTKRSAMWGTALDEYMVRARKDPSRRHQLHTEVTLPSGRVIGGTGDEFDVDEPSYTDFKTKDGLAVIRRYGSSEKDRYQRHLNYAGAVEAGLMPEDGIVRNIYIDRAGSDEADVVVQEPFDRAVVKEADEWLGEVQDAVIAGDECPKDPPRTMCRDYCQFFSACRGGEIEVEFITSPRLTLVVDRFAQAVADEKEAHQRREELRPKVLGVTGKTARSEIVTTTSNTKRGPVEKVEARVL